MTFFPLKSPLKLLIRDLKEQNHQPPERMILSLTSPSGKGNMDDSLEILYSMELYHHHLLLACVLYKVHL